MPELSQFTLYQLFKELVKKTRNMCSVERGICPIAHYNCYV